MTKLSKLTLALVLGGVTSTSYASDDLDTLQSQLKQLKQQMQLLENKLADEKTKQQQINKQHEQQVSNISKKSDQKVVEVAAAEPEKKDEGIKVGGAIRFNYSTNTYDEDTQDRGGDFDFDIFRINVSGEINDISLNGEIRFYDYMTVVKYAYLGYEFADGWEGQAGIAPVPFGNGPYNSHSYFFSTNYYVGLEDDFDLGVVVKRKLKDNWKLDLGFFKNDELGGIDGGSSDINHRYSYDIIGSRSAEEGTYDAPGSRIGEYNTFAGRATYQIEHSKNITTDVGVSLLSGGLHDGNDRAGNYGAWAFHVDSTINNWNIQFQHGEYDYDLDDSSDRFVVGAYAYYDTVSSEATMTNFNVAYNYSLDWGPVTDIQFYNDYGIIYDKSDDSADTWMNVTGMSVAAGGFFSYFDFIQARNQPFIGGTIIGDGDTERRFNINIGYYF
ncbi:carbohydrate porin [Pseudoalteromonas sp. 31A1]|uniref:carbohydrate porin n=1 Tax=Pseudoalteromonas sp. 31A1 TaxID=2686351 RepID=UPI0013FDDA7C|nr:carbohydrate porin [Pseudoalteromonas sp. 31A1]